MTTDGSGDDDAAWSSDGTRVAYSVDQDLDGDLDVFVVPADMSAPPVQLTFLDGTVEVDDWHGDVLAVHHHSREDGLSDLLMLRMNESEPEDMVVTERLI